MNKYYYYFKIENVKEGCEAVCTHFVWSDNIDDLKIGEFTIKDEMFIVNYDNGIGGVDNFKKWLKNQNEKGTPIKINYVLKTPQITEISEEIPLKIIKEGQYDVEEIASLNNLKSFVLFKCDFPYYLQISNGIYNLETDVQLSENIQSIVNEKRKIIFCVSRKYIDKQKISPKSGSVEYKPQTCEYSFFISNMEILVEIKEKDFVKIPLSENEEETIRILQSSLELISAKYNEAMAGKDFWNPLAQEVGAQRIAYMVKADNKEEYELRSALISSGVYIKSAEDLEKEKIEEILGKPYKIWRYFFNKAKYCFENYNNLECIIYSYISIEAYINNIIENKRLNKELDVYQQLKQRRNCSFFHLTEFLHYKSIFTKEDMNFVNSIFGRVNNIRNNIVHGKINTPIQSRENAKAAKDGAISIIKRFEK